MKQKILYNQYTTYGKVSNVQVPKPFGFYGYLTSTEGTRKQSPYQILIWPQHIGNVGKPDNQELKWLGNSYGYK